ncbi:hypothetical protein [Nocardiopsis sp. NPDC006832]|uniref:hypothetical protein n=1 Tax=Nocardiopsis sp. NPDC006832 TaxID=3157188 RepID=UPI0033FEFB6E
MTDETFRRLFDPEDAAATEATHAEIRRLRERYRFFHWHLEFPDIFRVCDDEGSGGNGALGWQGGFDCVLSNPPWDKLDFEDKKYFSVVEPSLARIAGLARREAIGQWQRDHPEEAERYRSARRQVKSTLHFAGRSEGFPACAKGLTVKGVNTLQVDHLFVELFTALVKPEGRIGAIVPTSIATGAGAQELFASLTRDRSIASLYDFENLKQLFPGVDARQRFSLLSLHGDKAPVPVADYAFFLHEPAHLDDGSRSFELTADEIALLSPNTGSIPLFQSRRDADLTLSIYRRIPVLWKEGQRDGNPWAIRFKRLFDMTDDSGLFRDMMGLEKEGWELRGNVFERESRRMMPLYEAKMAHHFDHRWNGFTTAGAPRQPAQIEKGPPLTRRCRATGFPERMVPDRVWPRDCRRSGGTENGSTVGVTSVDRMMSEPGFPPSCHVWPSATPSRSCSCNGDRTWSRPCAPFRVAWSSTSSAARRSTARTCPS